MIDKQDSKTSWVRSLEVISILIGVIFIVTLSVKIRYWQLAITASTPSSLLLLLRRMLHLLLLLVLKAWFYRNVLLPFQQREQIICCLATFVRSSIVNSINMKKKKKKHLAICWKASKRGESNAVLLESGYGGFHTLWHVASLPLCRVKLLTTTCFRRLQNLETTFRPPSSRTKH